MKTQSALFMLFFFFCQVPDFLLNDLGLLESLDPGGFSSHLSAIPFTPLEFSLGSKLHKALEFHIGSNRGKVPCSYYWLLLINLCV